MSFITLILIKNKQLQTIKAHYHTIKKIIEHPDFEIETVKQNNKIEIDAGYILIDCDKKILVNSQDTFHLTNLNDFQKIIV